MNFVLVPGYQGLSGNDIPVLFSMAMSLKTQPFPRINHDSFDLMVRFIGQNLIVSPGTMIFFHDFIGSCRFLHLKSENLSLNFGTKVKGGLIFGVVHPEAGSVFAG